MELVGGIALASAIIVIWWILEIVADWKIFEKAGKPGWHSIIPFLNTYDEYDLCWNGAFGILYMVIIFAINMITPDMRADNPVFNYVVLGGACVLFVLQIIQSNKLAKAFGKGFGWTLCLIFFDRIARIVLGFSDAQYVGKDL